MAKTSKHWAVYVHSYDHAESRGYWKFVAGPFTKNDAAAKLFELRRANTIASYMVHSYVGPRVEIRRQAKVW